MMTFTLLDPQDREVTVKADSRDILRWEKTGKDRSFSKLAENPRMTDLYSLAFSAAKRQGVLDGCTPQEFEEDYVVQLAPGEDADPTQ